MQNLHFSTLAPVDKAMNVSITVTCARAREWVQKGPTFYVYLLEEVRRKFRNLIENIHSTAGKTAQNCTFLAELKTTKSYSSLK